MYGLDSCSLRIANPYGEYQRFDRNHGAVTVFCEKAIKKETIEIWGDGNIERDFIYIKDVISAMLKAFKRNCNGEEINIGCGKGLSLNDIVSTIEHFTGEKLHVKYLPARPFDVPVNYLDITKARNILRWVPQTSIDQGIEILLNWLLKKN